MKTNPHVTASAWDVNRVQVDTYHGGAVIRFQTACGEATVMLERADAHTLAAIAGACMMAVPEMPAHRDSGDVSWRYEPKEVGSARV